MLAIAIRYSAERLLPLLRLDSYGHDYIATNKIPDGPSHAVSNGLPDWLPDRHSPVQVPWRSVLPIVQWHFA